MARLIAASVIALALSIGAVAEEVSPAKQALIDSLLEQTGQSGLAIGKQFSDLFIQQMSAVLTQTNPNIDPRAFTILEEEVTAVIDEEFVINDTFSQMIYPIYAKHFTEEELEQMIAFNKTELGQKLIRVMPQVSQEGMVAGQQYGQQLGPKIQQRLLERFKEEGIIVE